MWELDLDMKSGRICHLNNFNRRCKTNFSEVYLLDLLKEFVPLKRSVRCILIFLLLNIIPEFPERTLLDYLYTGQLPQSVDEEGKDGSKWIMMSIGFCFIVFSCCFLHLLCRWAPAPGGQIPPACSDQAPWGRPCKVAIDISLEDNVRMDV